MRITRTFFFVAFAIIGITLIGCNGSKESLSEVTESTEEALELYMMVRVNKSETGLKVVSSDKKIDPVQHHSRTDHNPPTNGDTFRCSILDSAGKVIRSREKVAPFQFPGSVAGQDAVVTFFIPITNTGHRAILFHQTMEGVWQEVYSTDLL